MDVTVKTGTTKGTTVKKGDILNILKRIEVILNGNDNIFDCDLKTYAEALRFGYGVKIHKDTFSIPDADTSKTFHVEIPIDFAFERNLISDVRALLPAQLLGSLQLKLTWGSISDILGTANNTEIDSKTKVRASIIEVYDNGQGENQIQSILDNLTRINEGVSQDEISREYKSYPADELPVSVRPVSALHLQTILLGLKNITDGDPTYDNDVIKQIKLENVKGGGEAIYHDFFADLQRSQKADFGFESDNPTGIVMIDWADIRNGGLANVNVDAIKWKFITAKPTTSKENAIRQYKRYIITGE